MSNYLIYDVEVFRFYNLIVFSDLNGNITYFERYANDNDELVFDNTDKAVDFIKGKTLVGYYNHYYDDPVLMSILGARSLISVKNINDKIIRHGKSFVNTDDLKSLDCFKQILGFPKLKKIQGNMGISIEESKIPFDLDRPLTKRERELTIKYCIHDVETTKQIFEMRKENYFDIKDILLEKLENDLDNKVLKKAYKWNTTTLVANLLSDKQNKQWSDWKLPDNYNYLLETVPQEVNDLWNNWKRNEKKGKVKMKNYGVDFEFGFGGLHGVNSDNQMRFENVKLLDVSSLYPNLIIKLNALGKKTQEYETILNQRLEVKHSDKKLSDALKLIINSTYGILNNQFSGIYNPAAALSVCIYGQLVIYQLAKTLFENGCKLININTDGIAFLPNPVNKEGYKKVWDNFEKEMDLKLELEEYDLFIQRDVNNYLAIDKKGNIKVKGGDVNRYHGGNVYANCNYMIIDKCIVECLINGVDPLETIVNNLDKPELFQIILNAGNTYQGTCDENGELLEQNVNRVFASKKGERLYKLREDGGKVMFADTPEKMMIFNDDLKNFDKNNEIDIDFYYQLAIKRLGRWQI